MRHAWRCKQCPKLVETGERREHLWGAHQVDVLGEEYIVARFFSPVWN